MNTCAKRVVPYGSAPGIYDENFKLYPEKHGVVGSGVYYGIMFRCSKCNRLYCTLGYLKRHFDKIHRREK